MNCCRYGADGSGKTTTLYAALNEANDEAIKIITTEDPVEYEIDGLVQVPIDDEIGKTFGAACAQFFVKIQIKFWWEKFVIRKLQKGPRHLYRPIVFTTLHTNDAPTAVTRLLDMGLEPFLISATLETIIAQRLVRTICTNCKAPYHPSDEELQLLDLTPEQVAGQRFFYGKGCNECKGTGYRGRTALFEILDINANLRELILENASSAKLRAATERSGMVSLRQAGIQKIFAGVSTIEEVVRETLSAED